MIMATRVLRAALLAMALAPAALSNVCAWYPGSCTANAIQLSAKGLTGRVNASWFSGLSNYKALYLDGNLLSYIAPASFDQMTSLTTLDLGSNSLVGFPSGLLDPLTSLGTLTISYNLVRVFPYDLFRYLTKVTNLDITQQPSVAIVCIPQPPTTHFYANPQPTYPICAPATTTIPQPPPPTMHSASSSAGQARQTALVPAASAANRVTSRFRPRTTIPNAAAATSKPIGAPSNAITTNSRAMSTPPHAVTSLALAHPVASAAQPSGTSLNRRTTTTQVPSPTTSRRLTPGPRSRCNANGGDCIAYAGIDASGWAVAAQLASAAVDAIVIITIVAIFMTGIYRGAFSNLAVTRPCSMWHVIDYVRDMVAVSAMTLTLPPVYRQSVQQMGWMTGLSAPSPFNRVFGAWAAGLRSATMSSGYPLQWAAAAVGVDPADLVLFVIFTNVFVITSVVVLVPAFRVLMEVAASIARTCLGGHSFQAYIDEMPSLTDHIVQWLFRVEMFFLQSMVIVCGLHLQYVSSEVFVVAGTCFATMVVLVIGFPCCVYYCSTRHSDGRPLLEPLVADYTDRYRRFLTLKVAVQAIDGLAICVLTKTAKSQVALAMVLRIGYAIVLAVRQPYRGRVATPLAWIKVLNVCFAGVFLYGASFSATQSTSLASAAVCLHVIVLIVILYVRASSTIAMMKAPPVRERKRPRMAMDMETLPGMLDRTPEMGGYYARQIHGPAAVPDPHTVTVGTMDNGGQVDTINLGTMASGLTLHAYEPPSNQDDNDPSVEPTTRRQTKRRTDS
ncbi:unnamed protein product (mitochondrion) [Plasmodiophora brassicae]|uniref:TRP C-terminal domain-containing protein n=1 Tax=Plasmodiophora brassicae TaxID=37360 RepID=A0A3P3YH76_PLABS|nr:unnamed protein product [Plasmodiophora brassicae]